MPKKIQNTSKAHLVSVPLPNHGASYTVISHQFVIDYAYQALAAAGFGIVDEEYRCTADGQIAQGIYKLNFNNDPELSMMFAWTNSYNKQVKFKCVVGAYINNSGSVMISGEVGSWVRKHTGTADTETKDTIDQYISNAHMYYTQLCSDKLAMETVSLNRRKQAQLLGVLFGEYEILTTEQASMVRDQMKKPYHVFKNTDSLWAFYNFVTNALQSSHPKTWMEDQRILHYFIGTICDFSAPVQPVSAPVADLSAPVDPLTTNYGEPENQTNLLVQIAEVTGDESVLEPGLPVEPADYDFSQTVDYSKAVYPVTETDAFSKAQLAGVKAPEDVVQEEVISADHLHQSEEIIEETNEAEEVPFDIDADDNAVLDSILTPCAAHDVETEREIEQENLTDIFPQDEIVQYTDPVGNTFEAPIVIDTIDLNETTKASVVVVENAEDQDEDVFAEADNFDLDFTDETNEDPDTLPDFF
jgi:hypothetical protein